MISMSTLLLRISAPLQSWGSKSKFDIRDTDYYPTKSGIVGMIAAALGRSRTDSLEDLTQCNYGVRIDYQGTMLSDFQVTEMSDYLGKGFNSNISHRNYLSDAIFLVGLEYRNERFIKEIADALGHPKYPLFLGRRSCPPTLPLVLKVVDDDLYTALKSEEWLLPKWRRHKVHIRYLRIIIDSLTPTTSISKDVPVSFSPFKREYRNRFIKEMPPKEVVSDIIEEHDPMKELR